MKQKPTKVYFYFDTFELTPKREANLPIPPFHWEQARKTTTCTAHFSSYDGISVQMLQAIEVFNKETPVGAIGELIDLLSYYDNDELPAINWENTLHILKLKLRNRNFGERFVSDFEKLVRIKVSLEPKSVSK